MVLGERGKWGKRGKMAWGDRGIKQSGNHLSSSEIDGESLDSKKLHLQKCQKQGRRELGKKTPKKRWGESREGGDRKRIMVTTHIPYPDADNGHPKGQRRITKRESNKKEEGYEKGRGKWEEGNQQQQRRGGGNSIPAFLLSLSKQ